MDPNNYPQPGTTPPPDHSGGLPPVTPPPAGPAPQQFAPPAYVPQQPYQTPSPYQQPPQPTTQDQYNALPPAGQFGVPATPPPRDLSFQQQNTPTPPPRPRSYGKAPLGIRLVDWLKGHWWAPLTVIAGLLVFGQLAYQFIFPMSALPLGTTVDGINIGGMTKEAATKKLDTMYSKVKVKVYFGDATVPYKTPTAGEIGIVAHNESRLQNMSYPLWLRFVPTSIWWAKDLGSIGTVVYDYDKTTVDKYTLANVGEDCFIEPQNASLKLDDGQFAVISAQPGGKCDINKFKDSIKQGTIGKDGFITVRTDINKVDAPLTDEIARQLGDELNHNLDKDKKIQAGGKTTTLPSITIKGWLSFKAIIPEAKADGSNPVPPHLAYVIEPDRVRKYFDGTIAASVEKKPGVTKISTTDFTETSHVNGAPGVLIDSGKSIASIDRVVLGRIDTVVVSTHTVPPTVEYKRKYTPTEAGYMALARQFGEDHGGHFGIKFQEYSGKKPWLGGEYRVNQPFPAAGVEGAYLAYAAQAGIEDGTIQPTDRIAGTSDVTECITAALADQDQDCIDALLNKVTNSVVMQRMRQLGMNNTSFSKSTITTTAGDLFKFINAFTDRTMPIKKYDSLTSPMRDIVLRDGLLAGHGSGSIYSVGGASEGYNEAATTQNKGKYTIVVVSEQKDAAAAKQLMEAFEKLHLEKADTKS